MGPAVQKLACKTTGRRSCRVDNPEKLIRQGTASGSASDWLGAGAHGPSASFRHWRLVQRGCRFPQAAMRVIRDSGNNTQYAALGHALQTRWFLRMRSQLDQALHSAPPRSFFVRCFPLFTALKVAASSMTRWGAPAAPVAPASTMRL